MNQAVKDTVYRLGTQTEVDFMAALGGMNDEEKQMFQMWHDGINDLDIQEELGMSKNAFAAVEKRVRNKLLVAVFSCIHYRMFVQ